MELIRSKHVPIPGSPRQFSWNKYNVLTTNLSLDIGDCNSEFLISLSEDNPCRLTHFPLILSQTAIGRYCVQLKQYRQ